MTACEEREQGWTGTILHIVISLVSSFAAWKLFESWQWWVCIGLPLAGITWEIGMRFASAPRGCLRRWTGKTWYASVRGLMAFIITAFIAASVIGGWL